MKKLTSFVFHNVGAGGRISYTFSEIDKNGNPISENNRDGFYVVDDELQGHVDAILDHINANRLNKEQ